MHLNWNEDKAVFYCTSRITYTRLIMTFIVANRISVALFVGILITIALQFTMNCALKPLVPEPNVMMAYPEIQDASAINGDDIWVVDIRGRLFEVNSVRVSEISIPFKAQQVEIVSQNTAFALDKIGGVWKIEQLRADTGSV